MRHVKICKTLDDNQSKRVLVSSHQIFCSVNLTCVGLRNCVAMNMYDCFLDTLSQITMFDRYISSDCAGSVTTPNAIPTYQILSIKIKKTYRTGTLTTVAVYNPDLNTTKSLAKHLLSTPISTTSSRKNCWRNDTKVVQGSGTGMISAPGHGFFSPEEKVYSHQYELQGVHICMPFSALQPRGKFSRRMFMACEARYRHKIKVALWHVWGETTAIQHSNLQRRQSSSQTMIKSYSSMTKYEMTWRNYHITHAFTCDSNRHVMMIHHLCCIPMSDDPAFFTFEAPVFGWERVSGSADWFERSFGVHPNEDLKHYEWSKEQLHVCLSIFENIGRTQEHPPNGLISAGKDG